MSERAVTTQPWDEFAGSYEQSVIIRERHFHLGPNGQDLDLAAPPIGLAKNDEVLDLGCGAGVNTRTVGHMCRAVTGVDGSVEQIRRARERTEQPNVRFEHEAIETYLSGRDGDSADFAYSVFALEYVEDLPAVMTDVSRVLRPGGRMLYCDLHPVASAADLVGVQRDSFIRSVDYFDEGARSFDWPSPSGTQRFVRFHRTLSTILESATAAGLRLSWAHEPRVRPIGRESPYEDQTISSQYDLWQRVPYTLVLLFEKP
jgi:SAM-dependent methyltransferase